MANKVKLDTKVLDNLIKTIGNEDVRTRVIHDGVEYGIFVELGTARGAAQPALVPAFERESKKLAQAVGAAIGKGVPLDPVMGKVASDIQAGWQANAAVDTGAYKNSITVSVE